MPVTRLNHAVLYVRDIAASAAFYGDVLGFRAVMSMPGASDHGTTKALYAKDPDGIEFEVSWLVPADRITSEALEHRSRIGRLDLAREKERYGATTRGGVGISVPAPL